MIILYGADLSSPSNKVRFCLHRLGLPYTYRRIRIKDGENKQDWFLALNPVGKIPVLDDDGFVLFESNAIIKYVCRKQNSPLYPVEARQRAVVDQWMDFVTIHIGGAMDRIMFNVVFAQFAGVDPDARSLETGRRFMNRFLPAVDNRLNRAPYLAGENFTLADMCLLAALDPSGEGGVDLSQYPHIVRWQRPLKQKEFYTRCHADYGEALKRLVQLNKGGTKT